VIGTGGVVLKAFLDKLKEEQVRRHRSSPSLK